MCNVYVRLSTNSTISLDTIVLFMNGYLVVDNKSNFINYTLSTEALRDMSPTVRQIVIRHCHLYIVPKLRHKCIRPYKFPRGMHLYSANRLRICGIASIVNIYLWLDHRSHTLNYNFCLLNIFCECIDIWYTHTWQAYLLLSIPACARVFGYNIHSCPFSICVMFFW